jgi:hypothetical protein
LPALRDAEGSDAGSFRIEVVRLAIVTDVRLDQEGILAAIDAALAMLLARDHVLLALHAHELALVHRFGFYLEHLLASQLEDRHLAIDLDYDRHGDMPKFLPGRPDRDGDQRFRPDLVVHRRMHDDTNILVVEWKKDASPMLLKLLSERLDLLTRSKLPADYGYDLGVLIDSSIDGIRWRPRRDGRWTGHWRQAQKEVEE